MLPDPSQRREPLQEIIARLADEAGEERYAEEHRQPAHRISSRFQMALEARDEGGAGLDGKRRDDERNAEPDGVDGEQPGALRDRLLGGRYGEDRGKDRPDARRPAEREGEP